MPDLKGFRKANNLTQSDVAEFLGKGVEKGFISQIEHGTRKLPDAQLAKLLQNNLGWDTSMLLNDKHSPNITTHASGNANGSVQINSNNYKKDSSAELKIKVEALQKEIDSLRQQLADEKKRSDQYWEMIQKLMSK